VVTISLPDVNRKTKTPGDHADAMKFPVKALTDKKKSDIYAASIVLSPDTFR
jgi:hypothetical protein